MPLGCLIVSKQDATTQVAELDGCAPDDFYSTTNHETHIRKGGKWLLVADQRMDAAIVIEGNQASCRKLRDIRQGDNVVCGVEGIRVVPTFQDRDRHGFAFMTNEVSSERRVEAAVDARRRDDADGPRPTAKKIADRRRPGRRSYRRRAVSGAADQAGIRPGPAVG